MNKNEFCCSVASDLNGNVSRLIHVNGTCGVKGQYKSRDGTITIEALQRRRRSKVCLQSCSGNTTAPRKLFKLTARQVNPITSPADGSDTNYCELTERASPSVNGHTVCKTNKPKKNAD